MAENKETPSASESDSDGSVNLPADDRFLAVPISDGGIPAQQKSGCSETMSSARHTGKRRRSTWNFVVFEYELIAIDGIPNLVTKATFSRPDGRSRFLEFLRWAPLVLYRTQQEVKNFNNFIFNSLNRPGKKPGMLSNVIHLSRRFCAKLSRR